MTDLAAALVRFVAAEPEIRFDLHDAVRDILAAARERLKLTRQPCETCYGRGLLDVERDERGLQIGAQEEFCPRCGGSGLGHWPADLTESVRSTISQWRLDGIDSLQITNKVFDIIDAYLSGSTLKGETE